VKRSKHGELQFGRRGKFMTASYEQSICRTDRGGSNPLTDVGALQEISDCLSRSVVLCQFLNLIGVTVIRKDLDPKHASSFHLKGPLRAGCARLTLTKRNNLRSAPSMSKLLRQLQGSALITGTVSKVFSICVVLSR